MSNDRLAAGSADATEVDWRRLAGPGATRPTTTDDGIEIAPLLARRTDTYPLTPIPGWRGVQRLTGADAGEVARQAADALAGGAEGLEIVFANSVHPLRSELPAAAARRLGEELGTSRCATWCCAWTPATIRRGW